MVCLSIAEAAHSRFLYVARGPSVDNVILLRVSSEARGVSDQGRESQSPSDEPLLADLAECIPCLSSC